MFIASVLGYIMVAVMVFCGVIGIVDFLQGDLKSLGAVAYIQGIAAASWPLVAAAALCTLLQVAALLEKLVIYTTLAQNNAAKHLAGMETTRQTQEKPHLPQSGMDPNPAFTRSFFHIEPDSTPSPMEWDSVAELARQTDQEKTKADTSPQEKSAQGAQGNDAAPAQKEQTEKQPEGSKLSFFRVD